jgi:hypothetical protein
MRGITLTQPWATLVAIGAKRIETRGWLTRYRGPLAIHAAQGLGPVGGKTGLRRLCRENESFYQALRDHITSIHGSPMEPADTLPRGAIVAVCELVDVVPTRAAWVTPGIAEPHFTALRGEQVWHVVPPEPEQGFGDYTPGRYAWLLDSVQELHTPVACVGALGLWDVPTSIADRVFLETATTDRVQP